MVLLTQAFFVHRCCVFTLARMECVVERGRLFRTHVVRRDAKVYGVRVVRVPVWLCAEA